MGNHHALLHLSKFPCYPSFAPNLYFPLILNSSDSCFSPIPISLHRYPPIPICRSWSLASRDGFHNLSLRDFLDNVTSRRSTVLRMRILLDVHATNVNLTAGSLSTTRSRTRTSAVSVCRRCTSVSGGRGLTCVMTTVCGAAAVLQMALARFAVAAGISPQSDSFRTVVCRTSFVVRHDAHLTSPCSSASRTIQ